MRTFALIKGGSVINHVVADEKYVEYVKDMYDEIIETTNIDRKPSIGDYYSDEEFISSGLNIIYPQDDENIIIESNPPEESE
jgi:hypothetical protein